MQKVKNMKRVFLIVLDSLGIGNAPDAAAFGDAGANTLGRIAKGLSLKNLSALGLGNIDGVDAVAKADAPRASHGRLIEKSLGKDTTIGHWELCGIVSEQPLPTYPEGFPPEVLSAFSEATGRGVLCNLPYSGTDVIRDYGEEHLKSGDLIVYTSADSVFQIAAHEELVPCELLYDYCKKARKILTGKHAVGRVIARPFIGEPGNFTRTANRRDFSLVPYGKTLLDLLCEEGYDVISVGKISDMFAGRGVSESHPTHGNGEGMETALAMADRDFHGLCFINLVDFDMLYGHRQDVSGYAKALADFDAFLPSLLAKLGEEDALIITADHGCDPGDDSTDHTRECVPLLIYGKKIKPENLGTVEGFSAVGQTVAALLGAKGTLENGENLTKQIL